DPGSSGDLTDPTGVLRTPLPRRVGVDPTIAVPVVAAVTPPPPPPPPPMKAPSASDARVVAAAPPPPPAAVVASVSAAAGGSAATDDLDPRDEFPEHPPTPGHAKRWFILLLVLLAVAGGVLAWYNSRPEMRTVPDVANMEEGVALNAIAGDFQGVLAQESSEKIDAGHVIRTDPATGTELEKNSTVTLFVSTGPAPRVLPELNGVTVADATKQLTDLGLVVEVGDPVFDETVPKDVVLKWSVPDSPTLVAGGTVTKGTAVRIVASAGPLPRKVPDLTGATLKDATAALTKVQLKIAKGTPVFSDTVPKGSVVSQTPAAAKRVARGSTVTVVLSKGHAPIKVPAITDTAAVAVRKTVVDAGFLFGRIEGDRTLPFIGLEVNGKPVKTGQVFPFHTTVNLIYTAAPATP
ncbi:MAG: hypothetical protein RJA49_266, partial [Actinomycetota bacterium]